MADPEGFLTDQGHEEDYLDMIVGGPEAAQHAGEIGGFVAGHEAQIVDQSSPAEQIPVHVGGTEQSTDFQAQAASRRSVGGQT